MRTTFRLKDREAKKETAIFIDIAHAGSRLKFYTDISIPPKFWNSKEENVKVPYADKDSDPFMKEYEKNLNLKLSDINAEIKKYPRYCIMNGISESAAGLKKHLESLLLPKVETKEFVFLVDFIEQVYLPGCESGAITFFRDNQYRRYSPGTMKSKRGVVYALKEFESARFRIRFEKVDMDFYDAFIKWSEGQGHKINQTGKVIKEIKTIMRYAHEQGIHNNKTWDNRKFAVLQEAVTSVALSNDELERLMALPLTGSEKHYRDVFVVGCYTALRISDYKRITPENIKDRGTYKVIEIITQKTKAKVVIPIASEILHILTAPTFYCRSMIEQKLNYKIKDLCKRAGINETIEVVRNTKGMQVITKYEKHELVSSHTARRTGSSYLYNLHGWTLDVMKITGHKSERAFLKYIKISAEEAAGRIAPKMLSSRQNKLKVVL